MTVPGYRRSQNGEAAVRNRFCTNLRTVRWLVALLLLSSAALAQECPDPGARLKTVHDAISDFQINDRAPAGADCASSWAEAYDLSSSPLDDEALDFYRAATDIQRAAAEKRRAPGSMTESDEYFDKEIVLRNRFLKAVVERNLSEEEAKRLRPHIVRHLSYMVSALAMRRQYARVAEDLGGRDPGVIDDEALKVWLQAVWSCAQWDGKKGNLCATSDREKCKDEIVLFLGAVTEMKNRSWPPRTRGDIAKLKSLTSAGGCLE